jgi:hypothetical protein
MFQSRLPGNSTFEMEIGPYDVLSFIPENTFVEPAVYFPTARPAQPPNQGWLFEN